MLSQETNLTINAKVIVETYVKYHVEAYGWEPKVEYAGNGWYKVENEVLHRARLMEETARLRTVAMNQEKQTSKGTIKRLIARLLKI